MTGLSDFRDFAAWQRAEELRLLCDEFLSRPGVRDRFRRAQQLDDAAASAPRDIAEGFGRFKPKVFANFVSIAKGSETEVLSIFCEARSANLISESSSRKGWVGVRLVGNGGTLALGTLAPLGPWHAGTLAPWNPGTALEPLGTRPLGTLARLEPWNFGER
jgi:four helix bundle protein